MNIFGGLGLGQGATVQLVFKTDDGTQPKTATVKAGGAATETLPLYTNKSTVTGEVILMNDAFMTSKDVHAWLRLARFYSL